MSKAIENLGAAQKRAFAIRPKVHGFPYLAETLRRAGVTRNFWSLPACQSIFLTSDGPVVSQGTPLVDGVADVPSFDREVLVLYRKRSGDRPYLLPNAIPPERSRYSTKTSGQLACENNLLSGHSPSNAV